MTFRSVVAAAILAAPAMAPMRPALPAVILYEHAGFKGRTLPLPRDADDLVPLRFNDIASSFKVRYGFRATFFEDIHGRGEWFTYNCPEPIGRREGDYCELANIGDQVTTNRWCFLLKRGDDGCQGWWNDRISSVAGVAPAIEDEPQGIVAYGRR